MKLLSKSELQTLARKELYELIIQIEEIARLEYQYTGEQWICCQLLLKSHMFEVLLYYVNDDDIPPRYHLSHPISLKQLMRDDSKYFDWLKLFFTNRYKIYYRAHCENK